MYVLSLISLKYIIFLKCQINVVQFWSCFVKECVNVILFACLMCLSKLCPRPSIVSRSSATMVTVQEVVEDTSANRQIIRKRVKRNSRVSMRKIARETGMKRESVRQMAKSLTSCLISSKKFNFSPMKTNVCGSRDVANSSVGPLLSDGSA